MTTVIASVTVPDRSIAEPDPNERSGGYTAIRVPIADDDRAGRVCILIQQISCTTEFR